MNIDKNKVLSNNSLLALRGGDELGTCMHFTCFQCVGEWYDNITSTAQMNQQVYDNCATHQAFIEVADDPSWCIGT